MTHPGKKIRVLVVEDSLSVRKHIVEVLTAAPDVEVVGEASDGRRAFELCQEIRPDVVTLDMVLSGTSGLSATESIMAYCPTPILIVSASTNRGELFRTYDALAAGAVDVLDKPGADTDLASWAVRLIEAVRMVSRIRVIRHPRARLSSYRTAHRGAMPARVAGPRSAIRAVGVGVSTGGPAALVELLGALPPAFPLPLLIVMHLSEMFASAFAEWLDGHSNLRVRFAKDREPLPATGCVVLAPADRHLVLRSDRLHLSDEPERHSCRPSVDVLFESLAGELGPAAAACLLTGMGRDGASGLLSVRRAGGRTIAQDEASSVIFGMPREGIQNGGAERVLPLNEIAAALQELARGRGREA